MSQPQEGISLHKVVKKGLDGKDLFKYLTFLLV